MNRRGIVSSAMSRSLTRVAALFVERRGVYYQHAFTEVWCKERDARRYDGPFPVVAHPPCERWGRYWSGGPSAKIPRKLGDDGGCFASALASVRRWGGVLEHPEGSHAFPHFGLRRPPWREGWTSAEDGHDGWVSCVAQGNYGHRARKLTWLYVSGVAIGDLPDLDWSIPEPRSRLDYGFHSAEERRAEHAKAVIRKTNAHRLRPSENLATPLAFRDVLIAIARSAKP